MARSNVKVRSSMTEAGRMLLLGTLFFFLTAAVIPAFGVLSALVAVLLTAWLVGFVVRPRVCVEGDVPDSVVAGHRVQLRYALKNVARLSAYDLHLEFTALPEAIELTTPAEVVSRLGPGETTEVTVMVRPLRRGYHRIPAPVCRSSFPFNLLSFSTVPKHSQTLTVLPVFHRLQMSVRGLSRYVRAGGAGFTGRTEVSPEYAGNRPFLPGDSPRRIDTRAWARLSVPVTKEYHNDSDSYAAILLDTRLPAGAVPSATTGQVPQLEAAVSLCASTAFTINQRCIVDALLVGPELHEYATWPRRARLNKMHEVLAGVQGSKGYALDTMESTLAERFYEMSEAIFILLNWDETYWHLLELAARAGCHSTVLLVAASADVLGDRDDARWADVVRVVSPDDVLAGRVGRL